MVNKQPEVTTRTRSALMDAFWELYKTTPIEKITVLAITRQAGFNRSTFYQYFSDVYEVLDDIETTLIDAISQQITSGREEITFAKLGRRVMTLFAEYGDRLAVLLGKNGDPQFAPKIKETMRGAFSDFYDISPSDPRGGYAMEFMLSGNLAVLTRWINSDRDLPFEEVLGLIQNVVQHGPLALFNDVGNVPAGLVE